MSEDVRRTAPAADRNKEPILGVLRRVLPAEGTVLEIASGTGQHVAHFAEALPGLTWQPSEPDAEMRASIGAWAGLPNVLPPLTLDVLARPWPVDRADAVLCINMIHIAPWAATLALMGEATRLLLGGAPLVLYGPYRRRGVATAPSNEAFDRDLKMRNPEWGLRELEAVEAVADEAGLVLDEVQEMPANNLCVVFRRR